MGCKDCINYKPKPKQTYEEFHVDRIRRVLESGKEKAVVPMNQWSDDTLTYTTIKEKVERIMNSLYELRIYSTSNSSGSRRFDGINWDKLESV